MIWVILFIFVALLSLWLVSPWVFKNGTEQKTELAEARAQLTILDAEAQSGVISPEMAEQSRAALERRVLALLDAAPISSKRSIADTSILLGLPLLIGIGSLAVYLLVGAPALDPKTEVQMEAAARVAFERDVASLAQQLAENPEAGFEGYLVLARGYMGLDQFDRALEAYQIALERSGDAPNLRAEMESAQAYVQRQNSGMNAQAEAIQALPEDEQRAMILAMVDGLATRLEAAPLDPQGWIQLIRSRLVLGQDAAAIDAVAKARAQLANAPELSARFEAALEPLNTELTRRAQNPPAQESGKP